MTYLGIDPGQSGAAALIHDAGIEIIDWPGSETAAADSLSWLLECYGTPTLCVVEQQQAPMSNSEPVVFYLDHIATNQ